MLFAIIESASAAADKNDNFLKWGARYSSNNFLQTRIKQVH